jgi:single-strand DNA-binding protein
MAYDNTVTIVGNLTRDPELKFTSNGVAVTAFGVAWNRKDRNDNNVVSFFDVTCWRDLAEHVAESLEKGQRVIVYGRVEQESWENKEGEKRSKVKIVADDVAPSLRWATVNVERDWPTQRSGDPSLLDGKSAMERTDFPAGEEPF